MLQSLIPVSKASKKVNHLDIEAALAPVDRGKAQCSSNALFEILALFSYVRTHHPT